MYSDCLACHWCWGTAPKIGSLRAPPTWEGFRVRYIFCGTLSMQRHRPEKCELLRQGGRYWTATIRCRQTLKYCVRISLPVITRFEAACLSISLLLDEEISLEALLWSAVSVVDVIVPLAYVNSFAKHLKLSDELPTHRPWRYITYRSRMQRSVVFTRKHARFLANYAVNILSKSCNNALAHT